VQAVTNEANFDPRAMLHATIEALGRMDVSALEVLSAEADAMSRMRVRVHRADAGRALALKEALVELLRSTERSLRMLRGLHEAGVYRIGEDGKWEH
jgi:hypothetical protein